MTLPPELADGRCTVTADVVSRSLHPPIVRCPRCTLEANLIFAYQALRIPSSAQCAAHPEWESYTCCVRFPL